ncbi:MAG TPA: hypothetical protein VF244_11420 [Acidimicrobiales bacterium]
MPEGSRLLRVSMVAAGLAVTYAAFVLYLLPDRSEDLFAWDIQPPLTAAFLGAMYTTGSPLLFLVARRGTRWTRIRPVLPPFVSVSVAMVTATIIHSERFIWSSPVTWLWISLYSIFPPLILYLYLDHQRRRPDGGDPPPTVELSRGLRTGAAVLAVPLAAYGLGLFLAPDTFDGAWPWPLTPLTARAVGGWLVSFGVALVAVSRERDWTSVRMIARQGILVTVLLLVAVVRFNDTLDWDEPAPWLFVAGLLAALAGATGVYAAWERRAKTAAAPG